MIDKINNSINLLSFTSACFMQKWIFVAFTTQFKTTTLDSTPLQLVFSYF